MRHSDYPEQSTIVNADPVNAGRRQFLGYAGAGMLAAVLPGCGSGVSAAPYARTVASASKTISDVLASDPQKFASISVALLKGNSIVWAEAFGQASVTPRVSATTQTRYNIGSVTKVVSALAGVILQDRGLIDLDTPIVAYLPAFSMLSPEYTRITTRHLLSHSSGMPGQNDRNLFTYTPIAGYAAATQAVLADEHLNHPPGQFAVYCNDGFTMFEQVVQAVTGQSFPAFVQEQILTPLNMVNSGFLTSVQAGGDFALGYLDGIQRGQEFANAYATGGLNTTPTDMMNLAQVLIDNGVFQGRRIASAAGIADMRTVQPNPLQGTLTERGITVGYGLGWDEANSLILGAAGVAGSAKSGATGSFSSFFYVLPDAQMALMIVGNNDYGANGIASGILFDALLEEGTIAALPPLLDVTAPHMATPPNVSALQGVYGNSTVPVQVVVNADSSLTLNQWSGTGWTLLEDGVSSYRYRSDGWWWSDSGTTSWRFDTLPGTDDAGNPVSYQYLTQRAAHGYVFGCMPFAQRLDDGLPALDSAWQARLNSSWNVMNESELSVVFPPAALQIRLGSVAGLPGYALFSVSRDGGKSFQYQQLLKPLADSRGGMAVRIPVDSGRDLFEISFSVENGVETMSACGWLCQRAGA